jgi:hypothetical protein
MDSADAYVLADFMKLANGCASIVSGTHPISENDTQSCKKKVGQTMSEGKDYDRSRRKKRRGQLDREKETRRTEQSRTANLESKTKDDKEKLDLRIGKLIDQGYSPESVAKRLGVSMRRINSALDSNLRRKTKAERVLGGFNSRHVWPHQAAPISRLISPVFDSLLIPGMIG